jgi:hypothetical protein
MRFGTLNVRSYMTVRCYDLALHEDSGKASEKGNLDIPEGLEQEVTTLSVCLQSLKPNPQARSPAVWCAGGIYVCPLPLY